MKYSYLGKKRYQEVWDYQEELREKIMSGVYESELILVEHEPTFTMGRAEKGENISDSQQLEKEGYEVIETNRGGKVTYHGPGQLVAYPVVNLKELKKGVKDYVCSLEKVMIKVCSSFNVMSQRKDGMIGCWVDQKKIGSIGIHVRKNVSVHGLALNVNPDMNHFKKITPCGILGVEMTSLAAESGQDLTIEHVIPVFKEVFRGVFSCTLEPRER